MVHCPNCKSEDYEIRYIEEDLYHGDTVDVISNVECSDCGTHFWVMETFKFDNAKNIYQGGNKK